MEKINFVSVDTTDSRLKIAILVNGKRFIIDHDEGLNHLENIIPLIDKGFLEIDQSKNDLKYSCVCCGPGSFTGIRIGIATMQGIGFAGGLNTFGFNIFDVYKYLFRSYGDRLIVPVVDAKKKQFFCQFINSGDDEFYDIKAVDIAGKIKKIGKKMPIFVGKDAKLLKSILIEYGIECEYKYENGFSADDLLNFTEDFIQNGKMIYPEPLYIRKSEAEISLLEKKGLI